MGRSQTERTNEQTHDWHPLPQLIGNAIVGNVENTMSSGGWAVRVDDGDVLIYIYDPEDDSLESHAKIPEPESGWDGGIESIPDRIWGGFR